MLGHEANGALIEELLQYCVNTERVAFSNALNVHPPEPEMWRLKGYFLGGDDLFGWCVIEALEEMEKGQWKLGRILPVSWATVGNVFS